jgi:hypothetical protein
VISGYDAESAVELDLLLRLASILWHHRVRLDQIDNAVKLEGPMPRVKIDVVSFEFDQQSE